MDKHLTWAEEIIWVREWLVQNGWLEEHVGVEFASDRPSCYYGGSEFININFHEVEEEEEDLENAHIQVYLHEVGHHIHVSNIDEETYNILRKVYEKGLDMIEDVEEKLRLKLYHQLPMEAEAEIGREVLYKEILKAGVV